MKEKISLLVGKRVLIVDDEPDVLEALEECLDMCDVVQATSFDQAKGLLETEHFDIAILDIMGVNGYKLLEIGHSKKIITIMLTAHALSVEDTVKSFKEGAASYIPKEKMSEIATYIEDVLDAQKMKQHPWSRWVNRFGSYYRKMFGSEWVDYEEFWKAVLKDKKF